jgi:hypothetical protein
MMPLRTSIYRHVQVIGQDVFVGINAGPAIFSFELDTGNIGATVVAPHVAEYLGWAPATRGRDEGSRTEGGLGVVSFGTVQTEAVVMDIIYDGNPGSSPLEGRRISLDQRRVCVWYD